MLDIIMNNFTLVSFGFFCFFALSLIIYYIVPRDFKPLCLLIVSLVFYLLSSPIYTELYLPASIILTSVCVKGIKRNRASDGGSAIAKRYLIIGIVGNMLMLSALKYTSFILGCINSVARITVGTPMLITIPEWASPIGISFYTLTAIGYMVDCYTGISEVAGDLHKDGVFISYWPALTSGPVFRYQDVNSELFADHRFDIDRICFGIQRMLWGIIKKIVISARLKIVVDTIYADIGTYRGMYIWIAAVLFTLQLYTDFSGCMDIILGASECYGIKLPENFRTPFFAKTIQEFWQRWHITLGEWFKYYVLYPIQHTDRMQKLGRRIRNRFGKRVDRLVSPCISMLFVWILLGLWHGGNWKYIAMGLYFWVIISYERLTGDWWDNLWRKLKVPTDTVGWKVLRCLKVFCLVSIGNMFFRLQNIKVTIATMGQAIHYNPWIFVDGSLYKLGLSQKSFNLMLIGVVLLMLVSLAKRKYDLRMEIARQPLIVRWGIYLVLLFAPMIFGIYGPGYDAVAFIYGGF